MLVSLSIVCKISSCKKVLLTLKQFLLNTFIMLFVGPFTLILYSCVAENKEFYLSTVLATYSCPVLSHYYLVLMNNYYFSPMAYLTWFSQLHFSERLAIA